MKIKLLIILIFFTAIHTYANTIQGILLDNETKAYIPCANVYFNTRCGTTTDMDGKFVLYAKNVGVKDTLWVSCIGYHRKAVLFKDLSFKAMNKIYLDPVTYYLDSSEISTARITPFQLLRDAFKNIKANCKDTVHYYKANYYEQLKHHNTVKKWHTRTLNCAVIVEDPGYDRLHHSEFGMVENVYILGINKGVDSITRAFTKEPNYLLWTMENNYYHYTTSCLNSPKSFDYKIKSTYYDSVIQKNMIEISITPKNPQKDFAYGEVYLSSTDHKIFKIHILHKSQDTPDSTGSKKKSYYMFLDSDIIVLYKQNKDNRMELSYIKYEFGDGSFYFKNNDPIVSSIRTMEFKVIGDAENGADLVKGIPKMDNNTTIYDQKVNNDKSFWLENNVILKEDSVE